MSPKTLPERRAKKPSLLGRLLALLPVSCILLYPLYLAAQLDICEETYRSPFLPPELAGLRVAFVSDIHAGAYLGPERVRALVDKINALKPDIIILGGDYSEDSDGAVAFFDGQPGFQAALCVIGVVGNHDRTLPEGNLEKLKATMLRAGVTPLVNEALLLQKAGKTLALAGVDDYYNGHPDLEKVARDCAGADFVIFAPHTPDILPKAYALPDGPFYHLALCGHTHGGQVALFGHSLKSSSDYGDRYRSGWYHEAGTDILVSNGVGTSFLPVRLGARPQIHLLTLETATDKK